MKDIPKELVSLVPDQGYVVMPQSVAELSEHVLNLVSNDPEVMEFVLAFCAQENNWEPEQVVNFLLLQAIVVNL